MPAKKPKLVIRLDLLKPQSSPVKLPTRFFRWLLSTGRYIFIFVEALVLIAFLTRFKLDADLEEKKEAIERQIPYIQELKPYEVLIRQTQLQLSTIEAFFTNQSDYPQVLKLIADEMPLQVKLTNLNFERKTDTIDIILNAETQNNTDVTSFLALLRQSQAFTSVELTNIGLEENLIRFSISAKLKAEKSGGKSL